MRRALTENQVRRLVRFLIEMQAGEKIGKNQLLSADRLQAIIKAAKEGPEIKGITIGNLLSMTSEQIDELLAQQGMPPEDKANPQGGENQLRGK